jgi:RNA polymerase sigma-70 factor (ECF subfamily)
VSITVEHRGVISGSTQRPYSDAELVRRSGEGDEGAFAQLEARHRAALRKWCAARSRTQAEADDLRQETLLRAWRGAPGFLGTADVRTWLYRIVVNAAADEARRRARRPQETKLVAVDTGSLMASAAPTPERVVVESVDLGRALAELPVHQRAVVTLIDLIGCSTAETARVCGIGEPTVRSRLSRGRRTLRRLLTHGSHGAHDGHSAPGTYDGHDGPRR